MNLSLDPQPGEAPRRDHPVIGYFAAGFGLLGIFTYGPVFVPLAFVCSIAALFVGQIAWAFVGMLLTVAGLLTSPTLLMILGMGAMVMWMDLPWY